MVLNSKSLAAAREAVSKRCKDGGNERVPCSELEELLISTYLRAEANDD